MERQLDPSAGYLLQKDLERRGIKVHLQGAAKAILGDNREAVLLEDGTLYDADIVVMAVGIRPETRIARDAGLEIARGIVVDDAHAHLRPAILSIGECVEHRGALYGLVAPLYDQAKVVAKTTAEQEAAFEPVELRPAQGHRLRPVLRRRLREGDDREEIVFRDARAASTSASSSGTTCPRRRHVRRHRRRRVVLPRRSRARRTSPTVATR